MVGPLAGAAEDAARPLPVPTLGPRPERRPFEHAVHLFLAAVGQGMAFEQALHVFGFLDAGAYSSDDRCFYPDAPGLGPISDRVSELHDASRLVIRGAEGEHDWTVFVVAGRAAAVVADRRIRIRWDAEIRRATGGLETLPDFIALPRDEREGDYADPHTSEESPRIMARRRGRRARRTTPSGFWTGWRRRRSGANGEQQEVTAK